MQGKVELVPGYGVYLTPRQLDEAVASGNGKPTKLMRCLLSVFFEPQVMAQSSALGSRANKPLDKDILSACISKCILYIIIICISCILSPFSYLPFPLYCLQCIHHSNIDELSCFVNLTCLCLSCFLQSLSRANMQQRDLS